MKIRPPEPTQSQRERSRVMRFLVSGGANTLVTYAVYLALLRVTNYKLAYTACYVSGILLSYVLNRTFVFRTHRGWSSALLFPLVYLVQYLISLATVWVWVEEFRLPPSLAPLTAVAISIPVTYILTRIDFVRNNLPS